MHDLESGLEKPDHENFEAGKMTITGRDITESENTVQSLIEVKERLESLWNIARMAGAEIKTICDHVLCKVQLITKSRYAFYGFLDAAQSRMMLHAWSDETMEACRVADKILHFPVGDAGLWADAIKRKKIIIINDFGSKHAGNAKTPDGHVPLNRLMVVPFAKGGQVVSIAAVANKQDAYTEEDGKQVEAFLANVQTLIDREKAMQDLLKSEQKFASVFGHVPLMMAISDRKKAEIELLDSTRNYREIFNAVNDVLIIHDQETGAIVDTNSKITELYGYEPGELIGRTVECLSSGDSPFGLLEASARIKKAIKEGPQLFEWLARHKSGETFWVEVNLKNTTIGGVDRLLSVVRDIRQRKTTELELHAYREHLEELVDRRTVEIKAKNTELETFTYSVSHDLKAPLRGIDGYSRLLVEDYADKLDEEGLQFLNNIRQSAGQMNRLIDDLLAYSRMERRDLNPAPLNVRQLIDELLFEREREISARSARVAIDITHDHIVGDRESIRQIMGNFIDNAIKYTADQPEPQIQIRASKSGDTWRFLVKDNGIGFNPVYHDRIFDIFQRLHRPEDFPGTGVGLALAKKAASRLNGNVWANGMPGRGATFYLEIPEPELLKRNTAEGALNGKK